MRLLILIVLMLIMEWYAFQAVRTIFENKWIQRIYLLISILTLIYLLYSFSKFNRTDGQTSFTLYTIGLFLLVYIPKMLVMLFLLGEDILRFFVGVYQYLSQSNNGAAFLPERRRSLSLLALGAAAIPFSSLLYGMAKGRYNYKVIRQRIFFKDLPEEFDGFTLMQLSDIHSGSFDDFNKIQHGIDLINQQNFDVLLFTGDIVNTYAKEMDDWIELFSSIKSPKFGKYSILGNHDYGEYAYWETQEKKRANFEAIKAIHPKIGFKLLLNENVKLKKGNSEISLIGVENWGKNFKQVGDLKKASKDLKKEDFKILLSHDPSHWDMEVQQNPLNYQLTLSGHTHGMQFGIEIPGFIKWSPVQYMYKHWAGLYNNMERYLYVNRGFGYHAYPGRVGIWPEITLIELKKG